MAIGGILIGVLMGAVAGVASLCLGASIASAFLLYAGIGVAASLTVMVAVALRTEDHFSTQNQESGAMMELGSEAAAFH